MTAPFSLPDYYTPNGATYLFVLIHKFRLAGMSYRDALAQARRELQWAAYQEQLRAYWQTNGPRPGAILEPVTHIEDCDPRRAQIEHQAARPWRAQ